MAKPWLSHVIVAALVAVDLCFALVAIAPTGGPAWLLVPFGALDAVVLAAIAKRSRSGAVAVAMVLAFVLFMFGFAAGTGALSGI
jgi:hypothetical protein